MKPKYPAHTHTHTHTHCYPVRMLTCDYLSVADNAFPISLSAAFFEYLAPVLTGLSRTTIHDFGGEEVRIPR